MVTDDLAKRSSEIHWPEGFWPESADVFAHNEVLINAPRPVVWQHLVAAEKWPQWYPNAHRVRVLDEPSGVLRAGSRFEWDTFGIHVASRVTEFAVESRLAWSGESEGYRAYHVWLLTDAPTGCAVVTEEVGIGPSAVAAHQADPDGQHRGHDLWLGRLKRLSETVSQSPSPIRR
jgi:uncharacterized protein YndB with AHSA1/START domain